MKAFIAIIATGVLALCTLGLPLLWQDVDNEFPDYAYAVYAVFVAMYIAAVPYFVGLFQAWRVLSYIDKGVAFSVESVRALKVIAYCAAAISAVYVVTMPFFYVWGERDDAPGLIVIGMVLVGAPLVVSIAMATLARLLSEVVKIKSENDLTV